MNERDQPQAQREMPHSGVGGFANAACSNAQSAPREQTVLELLNGQIEFHATKARELEAIRDNSPITLLFHSAAKVRRLYNFL